MKNKNYLTYRNITVEMTNGFKFNTKSTYYNNYLKLDIDPISHPAWTKKNNYSILNVNQVSKFNTKFNGINFNKVL